jgi:hypothetical protein
VVGFRNGIDIRGRRIPDAPDAGFVAGWAFGILFQYSTIAPMRGLSFSKGLLQAIGADTLAIIAFEIGLFAWMTLAHHVLFPNPPDVLQAQQGPTSRLADG